MPGVAVHGRTGTVLPTPTQVGETALVGARAETRATPSQEGCRGTTMNSIVLVLAMSAGQGPAGGYQLPPGYGPQVVPGQVGARPGLLPSQTPQPVPTAPGQPMDPAAKGNGNGNGNGEEEKKDEEKKDEAPGPWALMRILKGTAF